LSAFIIPLLSKHFIARVYLCACKTGTHIHLHGRHECGPGESMLYSIIHILRLLSKIEICVIKNVKKDNLSILVVIETSQVMSNF